MKSLAILACAASMLFSAPVSAETIKIVVPFVAGGPVDQLSRILAPWFWPPYRQVRDILVKRIADEVWRPGQHLPSEPEVAADLGVSQDTVRKGLDSLTADHFMVRRQHR